jgi:hypothetical protein
MCFATAYEIHRNNPRAIEGLEQVADRWVAGIAAADSEMQERALKKLYCDNEYTAGYRPVLRACRDVLGTECSVARFACEADSKLDCN